MKRGRESSGDHRRSTSDQSLDPLRDIDDDDSTKQHKALLQHQNKALAIKLLLSKREIKSLKNKMDLLEKKKLEMESFVAMIDRAWAQLESDTGLLMQTLSPGNSSASSADEPSAIPSTVSRHHAALSHLLDVGNRILLSDSMNIYPFGLARDDGDDKDASTEMTAETVTKNRYANMNGGDGDDSTGGTRDDDKLTSDKDRQLRLVLDADEWSSSEEIKAERARLLLELSKCKEETYSKIGSEIEARTALTRNILQNYKKAIESSFPGLVNSKSEFSGLNDTKELREMKGNLFLLQQQGNKLRAEIVELTCELHLAVQAKARAERDVIRMKFELESRPSVPTVNGSVAESITSSGDREVGGKNSSESQVINGAMRAAGSSSSANETFAMNSALGNTAGAVNSVHLLSPSKTSSSMDRDNLSAVDEKGSQDLMQEQHSSSDLASLRQRIAALEQQLTESEAGRLKLDKLINERLEARYFGQSLVFGPSGMDSLKEKERVRAVDDLKKLFSTRENSLMGELKSVREKAHALEQVIEGMNEEVAIRCEEAVEQAKDALQKLQREREELRVKELAAASEIEMAKSMARQVSELEQLVAGNRDAERRLAAQVRMLSQTKEELEAMLASSQKREAALEKALGLKLVTSGQRNHDHGGAVESSAASSSSSSTNSVSEENNCDKSLSLAEALQLLKGAQKRNEELDGHLSTTRENINDLISEIEGIAAGESSSREQNARLLQQISEGQQMQRAIFAENNKLHEQMKAVEEKGREVEEKQSLTQSFIQQQENLISSLKSNESAMRTDLHVTKLSLAEHSSKKYEHEQYVKSMELTLKAVESKEEEASARSSALRERCDELSQQLDLERRQRMELQREAKRASATDSASNPASSAKKPKPGNITSSSSSNSNSSSSNGTGNSDRDKQKEKDEGSDAELLSMTLNMLRCSVCKDRFKSAAITRCFHLFCKECIDENLRNRHRKCPACGEKFGQDDVKTVYFTH